jgi:tRNA threonylcarbamoyladenosine biosynthesis protein TsaE
MMETFTSKSPDETFALGERLGSGLRSGDVVLLRGGLGAGKTLLTKGIVHSLDFDVDEVTSPSFALVNLYKTAGHNIYHIDLWRVDERGDAAFAVGLDEILEDPRVIVIIEWAERLGGRELSARAISIDIEGDGDGPRRITIIRKEQNAANAI